MVETSSSFCFDNSLHSLPHLHLFQGQDHRKRARHDDRCNSRVGSGSRLLHVTELINQQTAPG
jgi:hypothetical protein